MATIKILVGSMYGNAQAIAEQAKATLEAAGHTAALLENASLEDVTADDYEVALVCSSTTGMGDIPDNLEPLFYALRERFPLLPHLRYGVIALGDSSYGDTFCAGGRQLDELFAELGARKVGERLEVDFGAHAEPAQAAQSWVQEWAALL